MTRYRGGFVCLLIAFVLFVIAAFDASGLGTGAVPAWLIPAGLGAFVLAFLLGDSWGRR